MKIYISCIKERYLLHEYDSRYIRERCLLHENTISVISKNDIEQLIKNQEEKEMADFEKIKSAAEGYSKDMNAFLRAIVKNPGESCFRCLRCQYVHHKQ